MLSVRVTFDSLPYGDMYHTSKASEASSPEVFAGLADTAIEAVTLPMKTEVYSTIAHEYFRPAKTAGATALRVNPDLGNEFGECKV